MARGRDLKKLREVRTKQRIFSRRFDRNDTRCDMPGKGFVVLDKEHGRLKFFDERFDLNARKKVDEVERLVPDI